MNRILLIKTGAFGDMILLSVSVNILHQIFPGSEIYLLTSENYAEIYRYCPIIKKIFTLSRDNNIVKFLKLFMNLRKMKFDIVFDLQGNLKTNFFSFLAGGTKTVGLYRRPIGKIFLTASVKKFSGVNPVEFQIRFWRKVINYCGDGKLQIWIPEEKKEKFHFFLDINGLEEKKFIVFHPSASKEWKTKLWKTEYWVELGNFFTRKNFPVVIIGDKNSVKLNKKIARSIQGRVVDLSGKTDFFETALLLKNAKFFITTDSGPMHMATATGTETIAIFGPTDPGYHCPPEVKYVKPHISCFPCYKKNCSSHLCMKSITPDILTSMLKIEN